MWVRDVANEISGIVIETGNVSSLVPMEVLRSAWLALFRSSHLPSPPPKSQPSPPRGKEKEGEAPPPSPQRGGEDLIVDYLNGSWAGQFHRDFVST